METPSELDRKVIGLFLTTLLIGFFVSFAYHANSDLTVGRFALFMDERISFDGVSQILNPNGFFNFLWALFDGGDHRYGRSMWNSLAIFSYFPELFFGAKGQIIASRMAEVIILMSAIICLTWTFVRLWPLRILLLSSLIVMPFTDYYATMPKPEPLQLLFVALFLFSYKKHAMKLNSLYWVFLGLAFGTKISTLPLVGVFLLASYISYSVKSERKLFIEELVPTFVFFVIGLSVAVPILLPNVFLSLILFWLLERFFSRKFPGLNNVFFRIILVILILILNLVVASVLYFKMHIFSGLAVWGGSTFLNTGHDQDSPLIGLLSWLQYFFGDWMIAPPLVSVVLTIISLFVVRQHILRTLRNFNVNTFLSFVVLFSGLVAISSIFISVHRLWGFYLYPGAVLSMVGLFSVFDQSLIFYYHCQNSKQANFQRYPIIAGLLLVTIITFVWWMPRSFNRFQELSSRSSGLEYKQQLDSYRQIMKFLETNCRHDASPCKVTFDPSLFIPDSTANYTLSPFWGYFKHWSENFDIIIFSSTHTPSGRVRPKTVTLAGDFLTEVNGYSKYVIEPDQACLTNKCYRRAVRLSDGVEILLLVMAK